MSERVMQKDLIEAAEGFQKTAGLISHDEATKLWESAKDGPGVTENEFFTLVHILENFNFTKKARAFLDPLAYKQASGSSIYKIIDTVKYDRSCLDLAVHLVKDGKIDLGDAKQLWADVEDGPGVTEVEQRTIQKVMAENTLTDGAKEFFAEKLAALKKPEPAEEAKAEPVEEAPAPKKAKATPKKAAPKEDEEPIEKKTGGRVRKQVELFAPEEKSEKEIEIVKGAGAPLADMDNVVKALMSYKTTDSVLGKAHGLFYGQKGKKQTIRGNIKAFSGFPKADHETVGASIKKKMEKYEIAKELKPLCHLFDVDRSGTKAEIIDRLVDFILKPAASGNDYTAKEAAPSKKRKASTKKKSKAKKSVEKVARPLSGYMVFVKASRDKVKAKNPDATFGELGKLMGAKWGKLGDEEKAEWTAKGVAEFKKNGPKSKDKSKDKSKSPAKKAKKAPAKKKGKKEESSEEEESEEEEEELAEEVKDYIKGVLANGLEGLSVKIVKAKIAADDRFGAQVVSDFGDQIKAFINDCISAAQA